MATISGRPKRNLKYIPDEYIESETIVGEVKRRMALFIKITMILFFFFVSIDSYFKVKRLEEDMENDLLNPKLGKVFRKRYRLRGILFFLGGCLFVWTLFLKLPFLGE